MPSRGLDAVDHTTGLVPFVSGPPVVRLVHAIPRPFENAVATARTCYSRSGIVTEEAVSGDSQSDPSAREASGKRRDALALSIYRAGHHTTLQHAHFQFSIENVSRQFLWSFLHSHPFYNSEQVSQRYVEVAKGGVVIPPLSGESLAIYESTIARQWDDYRELTGILMGPAESAYRRLFPARKMDRRGDQQVRRRAQEVARYVLPVAATAYLYHTVSALTILRYWRMARSLETSLETQWVVGTMVNALLSHDPLFATILEDPLRTEEMPEPRLFRERVTASGSTRFAEEFDRSLGGHLSVLVDHKRDNESIVAGSVREVLGISSSELDDNAALALVLDPASNPYLAQTLNVGTHSKLTRCLAHASYTFRKRLSHTADSQDQRHRMVPGSRPLLLAHTDRGPDFVMPDLVRECEPARILFEASMGRTWEAQTRLLRTGVPAELALYVLPNALSIRFSESADLLNLHHKLKNRLCHNSQEEIYQASCDEVAEISRVNPTIGRFLMPPCGIRHKAGISPICPEGVRYCGTPVWRLPPDNKRRIP